MNLIERLHAELETKKTFEYEHGYTMPEAIKTIDGQVVDAYTFNQESISVQVGCRSDYENDNHGNPLVIRLTNIGGQGQGEAKIVFRDGQKAYFEMSTFGCWEYSDAVRAFEFILDVLKNGKPTKDYCPPIEDDQENTQ